MFRRATVVGAIVVFACGGVLAGCGESERGCIERVLREDRVAGSKSDPTAVVVAMRRIETSRCPADFRDSYYTHILAWQAKSEIKQAIDGITPPDGFIDGTLKLLGAFALAAKDAEASQAISQTFHDVERVAVRHGASLSGK
jgi:hypothetical protein